MSVWPPDVSLSSSQADIRIFDSQGRVVARVGEEIQMGGGEARALEGIAIVDQQLQRELPTLCPGPYWLVGDFPGER